MQQCNNATVQNYLVSLNKGRAGASAGPGLPSRDFVRSASAGGPCTSLDTPEGKLVSPESCDGSCLCRRVFSPSSCSDFVFWGTGFPVAS